MSITFYYDLSLLNIKKHEKIEEQIQVFVWVISVVLFTKNIV